VSVQAGPPPGAPGGYTRTGNPDDGSSIASDPTGSGRSRITSTGRSRRSPWLLRNWRLRNKLIVVLVVPLVLAGALGGLRIVTTSQTASDLGAVVDRVTLAQQVSAVVDQLQIERTLATAFVAGGRPANQDDLKKQFAAVDAASAVLLQAAPADFGPGSESVANAALVRLRGVPQVRAAVIGTKYQTDAVLSTYTEVINSLLALGRSTLAVQDAQLLREAEDVSLISQAKEQVRLQHAALMSAATGGYASTTEENLVRSSAAQFDSSVAQFRATGQQASLLLYAGVVSGPEVDNRERIEAAALTAFGLKQRVRTTVGDLNTADGRTAELIRQVETQLEGQLSTDSTALASEANSNSRLDILAVVLAVVLTVLVLVLVARSIIRPLRGLRTAAFDVAQRRLPQAIERMQDSSNPQDQAVVEPIGIDTDEEIGEVARAFDAVHAEAIRLAGEQALLRANVNDIFVNLSRRSQGLVKRQLGLIDKLESDEQDPDHLGDLFQLDHLATRMRRNNENLLVLAGAAELRPRRRRPVPTEDVLRAAVSEVEDYQRVVVRRAPSVSVAGPAVNDLVHLMAELLDNATNFSPPDSTVVLSSTVDGDRGLVIEISDSGVGIEPQTLRTINAELADPPTVDAAVSRRMGLFVVGRLAQRNDIMVQLQSAPVGQGTIAVVTVPSLVLMTPAQAAAAEMATSEFPAANGPASGSWAAPEPAVPAPRTPARPVEPSYAWPEPPLPPATVPAPRGPRDSAPVTGWSEFEVGTEQQRPPAARRPEWVPPGGAPQQPPVVPPSLPRRPQQGPPQIPAPAAPMPAQAPPPGRGDGPTSSLFDPGPTAVNEVPDDSPIYDEVRTSWFRMDQLASSTGANAAYPGGGRSPEGEADPANGAPGNGAPGNGGPGNGGPGNGRPGNGAPGSGSRGPSEPSRRPGSSPNAGRGGGRPDIAPAPAPARMPAPVFQEDRPVERPAPASAPVPASAAAPAAAGGNGTPNGNGADLDPDGSSPEWGPIENGWRAAREFTELTREFLTEAGLPKRRAGGRPLPGSFSETTPSAGQSARNPDAVRGRLREYQRGLRHGRYAQREHVGEPTASSTAAGPE
jgi:signal transduction histidine kinase